MIVKRFRAFFVRPEIILFVLLSSQCSNPSPDKKGGEGAEKVKKPSIHNVVIKTPKSDAVFKVSDIVDLKLSLKKEKIVPDSIQLYYGAQKLTTLEKSIQDWSWDSKNARVGRASIRTVAFYGDSLKESGSVSFTLLSDVVPKKIKYEVVAKYPHDVDAFTQGLVYQDGVFYEGTGQYKKSSLRKVDVKTGKVSNMLDIADEYFGEGIAIYGDKIFQLTWKSQVGFIYDKESFSLLQKIYYDTKEGWGLTYDGKQFILSDGTAKLYFIEPEYFTETGQVEVYDDKGMVSYLNELEYIDGLVFANIWGKENIAIIDPANGKVLAYLDMSAIIPEEVKKKGDRVLNGIAYNSESEHIYLTGKYWPLLFEIKLLDKIK